MKWTKDKSIKLSLACVYVFAVILLVMDVLAFRLVPWFTSIRQMSDIKVICFYVTIYSGSVFAWLCLWALRRLIGNIQAESVFTADNVALLRRISWCCAWASIICFISSFYYVPFFLIGACSAFMMLIVRIVKNVFQQALDMKSELDLTI